MLVSWVVEDVVFAGRSAAFEECGVFWSLMAPGLQPVYQVVSLRTVWL